jgi:RNA polymerase sigma-70 factor (ECF subfamily)
MVAGDRTDRDLVDLFVSRQDEDAFRLLFRRHTPRVYALALRLMGGRRADAEDVVQEMWHRASRRLRTFEWRSALSTWLASIAINCARERLRGLDRLPLSLAEIDVPSRPPAASPAAVDLDRAIARLPDGCRAVLVLHDVEGFTHEEIGRQLEIAVGTSKSQLSRARRLLRARLTAVPVEVDRHAR